MAAALSAVEEVDRDVGFGAAFQSVYLSAPPYAEAVAGSQADIDPAAVAYHTVVDQAAQVQLRL